MNWTPAFLKSRPLKYGFFSGCFTLAAGAGGSAAVALRMASYCSAGAAYFISSVGQNITISDVDAVVHFGRYDANLTLGDINIVYPQGWLDLINSTKDLSPYCFFASFAIGLGITATMSLALANIVAFAVHAREEGRLLRLHPLEAINADEDDENRVLLGN